MNYEKAEIEILSFDDEDTVWTSGYHSEENYGDDYTDIGDMWPD